MKKALLTLMALCSSATWANPMTQQELIDLIDSSHQQIQQRLEGPNAFVAISLSMPKESLLRLARDAKEAQVPLIVRGVPVKEKKSAKPLTVKEKYGTHILVKGMQAFQFLMETGATIQIDPRSFDVYDIQDVPQLIIANREAEPGQNRADFYRVRGDVTLAYSLAHVQDELKEKAKKSDLTAFEAEVNRFIDDRLDRLEGRP